LGGKISLNASPSGHEHSARDGPLSDSPLSLPSVEPLVGWTAAESFNTSGTDRTFESGTISEPHPGTEQTVNTSLLGAHLESSGTSSIESTVPSGALPSGPLPGTEQTVNTDVLGAHLERGGND